MSKKYDLKLNYVIKLIVDLYNESDPLGKHNTASSYIKPLIYKEINKLLDYLDEERKKNRKLEGLLKEERFKEVLEILELKKRY